jgi:hypothetical protein
LIGFQTIASNPVDFSGRSELEFGDKFQGDMVLDELQRELIAENSTKDSRTGLLNTWYRWPKSAGYAIVPCVFQASAGFSKSPYSNVKIS